jgi:hypothetical protein
MSFNPFHYKSAVVLSVLLVLLAVSTCSQADTADRHPRATTMPDEDAFIRVRVFRLSVDPASQQPVVTLTAPDERRVFPIWIGLSEARAIHMELEGTENFRPLTHDLLAGVVDRLDGTVIRVMITHIKDNVFYATLVIKKNKDLIEVDARPSDSIVMALKFDAPIYLDRSLFEIMSIPVEDPRGGMPGDIGKNYGLSIQEITPELARYMSLKSAEGVMVSAVRPGSQADKDGIRVGDILIEINGQNLQDVNAVQTLVAESDGDLKAQLIRDQQTLVITLRLRELPP